MKLYAHSATKTTRALCLLQGRSAIKACVRRQKLRAARKSKTKSTVDYAAGAFGLKKTPDDYTEKETVKKQSKSRKRKTISDPGCCDDRDNNAENK